ncbi:MAG TPA: thioesterase family protein [Steroidobacteraceae bacterium]
MAGIPLYGTPILPEWIDYNGHLRDAYYGLIFSQSTDALMDRIGLDAAYRARTGGTLYTVEMHLHYLQEVKAADVAEVGMRVLAVDAKRIHLALELSRKGRDGVAAAAEVLLLHVRQHDGGVSAAVFPAEVAAALAALKVQSESLASAAPASRRMDLRAAARP